MGLSRRAWISEISRALAFAGTAVVAFFAARAARPASRPPKRLTLRREEIEKPTVVGDLVLVPGPDNSLRAFSRRCPHLGCEVRVDHDGSGLSCPCHGSRFALSGARLEGPAPSGLRRVSIRVDAGSIIRVP